MRMIRWSGRESSIANEKELLDLQTKNLEMHSTTLSQGKSVLNTVTQTGEQIKELNVIKRATSDSQTQVQDSFLAIRNETELYFNDIHAIMNWTNTKVESVVKLQELLQTSFFDIRTLLVFSAQILISFLITSLPGVGVGRENHP